MGQITIHRHMSPVWIEICPQAIQYFGKSVVMDIEAEEIVIYYAPCR